MNVITLPGMEGLIKEAAARGASDLHLIPGQPPAMRIGASLQRMEAPALTSEQVTEVALAAIGEDKLSTIGNKTGEAHKSLPLSEELYGTVSVARAAGEYTVVIRLLPSCMPSVEAIQVPEAMLKASSAGSGLVIFSGETGSGKTTTMFTVLEHMNQTRPISICTVEDPMVYRMTRRWLLYSRGK